MSMRENDLIKKLLYIARKTNKPKTSPYDTVATVTRIEDGVTYVHFPGGIDETPIETTIGASPGDTVRVRCGGGSAWITGNATAPPTDDTYAKRVNTELTESINNTNVVVRTIQRAVNAVKKIADNTNQYFWHVEEGTDTGAHITEIPQEEFLADPENGGGNLLARSNGVAVRDGLTELAQFRADGMAFNDSAGNKVVDIDTGGGDVTRAFSKRMFEGVALYQDTPVTLGINHPYFSGDIAIDGHFYGILSNGNIAYTTIDDLSSDFSTTSDNVRIEYSAVAGQFTLTYTGSSEGVTVFRFVFAWKQQVPKTFFSFGWRWRERIAGIFSAIIGEGLQARYDDQVVVGKYNNNKSTNIFEVGIGTDDTVRRNGLEVTSDGDVYAYGKFKIDGGSNALLRYYSVTTPATTIHGNSGALCQTTFTMPSPYTHVIGVRQVSSNHGVATGINTFGVDGDGASGNTITCHAYVRNYNQSAITDETVTFELFLASL